MASEDPPAQAVVLESGTGEIRIGFAGEETPQAVFPPVVADYKYPHMLATETSFCTAQQPRRWYCGDEALAARSHGVALDPPIYPVVGGIVRECYWLKMERLWRHAFYDRLRIAPEEHPLLLAEPPLNPRANREKTAQLMFEEFNATALCLANQAVLSLYASGRTTGLVLDSGLDVSHVVPVYEGHAIRHSMARLDMAGRQLTAHLQQLLSEGGPELAKVAVERLIVRDIKEKLCYVALDYDQQMQQSAEKSYELPDGQVITVDKELYRCTEALFRPELLGLADRPGLHEAVYRAIMSCDPDLRPDLYRNVLLSGGTTLLHGLQDRLQKELTALAPHCMNIKVVAPPESKHSVWIGGSVLASLSTFLKIWISKEQYDEFGPDIVQTLCFSVIEDPRSGESGFRISTSPLSARSSGEIDSDVATDQVSHGVSLRDTEKLWTVAPRACVSWNIFFFLDEYGTTPLYSLFSPRRAVTATTQGIN